MSEWFKELVLKTSDSVRGRGFESHLLRSFYGRTPDGFIYIEWFVRSINDSGFGEVPKRLKGHPWKGCRSLIAAHGFKSHLLRSHLRITDAQNLDN